MAPAAPHRTRRRARARVVTREAQAPAEVHVRGRELQGAGREVDRIADLTLGIARRALVLTACLALVRLLLLGAGRYQGGARRARRAGLLADRHTAVGEPLLRREGVAAAARATLAKAWCPGAAVEELGCLLPAVGAGVATRGAADPGAVLDDGDHPAARVAAHRASRLRQQRTYEDQDPAAEARRESLEITRH